MERDGAVIVVSELLLLLLLLLEEDTQSTVGARGEGQSRKFANRC